MPIQENDQIKKIVNEKLLATISYVTVGFLLPLIFFPENERLQFHAKQGLFFFAGWIIILIILAITPTLGILLFLAYFALNIIVVYRTYNGENWKIPLIEDFAQKTKINLLNRTTESSKPSQTSSKPENNKSDEEKNKGQEKDTN